MLNEDKIRLMTELSLYEKKEHNAIFEINSFFKREDLILKEFEMKKNVNVFIIITFTMTLFLSCKHEVNKTQTSSELDYIKVPLNKLHSYLKNKASE